jgi:hypothetical protein
MRSSIVALAMLAVLAAGANVPAFATPSSAVDELRAEEDHAARQAAQTKGAPQHLLLMKKQRISSLIDRLQRGESVDPREIDRLLEEPAGR